MNNLIQNTIRNTSDAIDQNNPFEPNLVLGDWFKVFNIVKKESVDLILTDLPYGILESQKWDNNLDLNELEKTIDVVLKPNGLFITFCNQALFQRLLSGLTRFKQRSLHIWHKTSPMPINGYMPLPDFEFILVLKKSKAKTMDLAWNPKKMVTGGEPYINKSKVLKSPTRRHEKSEVLINKNGKRWVHSIIEAPNKPNMKKIERTKHPTQKPEQLLRQLIRGYSNPGCLILDPFAGSFSTIISAYKEKRRSIGVELEAKYFEEAKKRIKSITMQQEIF